jgi:hypothetical protein
MAENENKVNTGDTGDEPKKSDLTPNADAPDALETGGDLKTARAEKTAQGEPAEKSGEGLKITGITFMKGDGAAAEKTADADLTDPKGGGKVTHIAFGKGGGEGDAVMPANEAVRNDGAAREQTAPKGRGGRPRKEKGDKPVPAGKGENGDKPPKEKKTRAARPTDGVKREKAVNIGSGASAQSAGDDKTPPVPETLKEPPRTNEKEEIIQIPLADLFPFKDHPFQVRDDKAMKNLVESVKERGVDQPALVRPREGGGYELVAGHRRQRASELAGYTAVPCIVRKMTDEEAVLAMAESNFNQRAEILPSERAAALKMQLDAIKRQGARFRGVASGDVDKRSNEIVAERNGMNYKTVQRYIALNHVAPDLMKFVDGGKVAPMTVAYQMSFLDAKHQKYIAQSLDGEARVPTEEKVKRMRELQKQKLLNPDSIDGIMMEENKKESC